MINFQFVSEALPEDTFQVLQFDAEEEVSQLFHVELRLVSRDPNIDFDLMLKRAARLSIITEGKQRNIHGMLAEFEQGGEWQNGLYEYRALLVPRLWMLSQSTQNQIFQDQTVLDIVASELKNVNKKGSNPLAEAGLGSDADYEAFTIRRYEEREYVVQYKETDLNFISRLLEHEGLYYYFEHNDDCEKLVITDTFAEEHISDNSEALFQSEASGVRYDNRVVYKLSRMQKQIPSSVLVKDFNYRSPSLPMQAMGDIDESGIGFVTEFGAHFKSPEEGEALATVRAEEFKCRQNTYSGESNISDFSCGHLYSLAQHFRSDYNQSYMLTKVRHQGSQEIESWGNIGSTKYSNQFDCIPALLQFRPQRLAVKPRLFGIMNGVIDSEQDLGRADLDEQGRYKVQMPFDISGVAPGLASRRIRMAQPYGGSGDDGGGTGMSFPLLKGAEVIWTCIDGDIDRPIITGAVPNPLKPSVTNTQNANSNVIKTSSGITMGFHDGSGSGSASPNTMGGGAAGGLAAQQQYQSMTACMAQSQAAQNNVSEKPMLAASSTLADYPVRQSISEQQQMAGLTVTDETAGADLPGRYAMASTNTGLTGQGKQWVVRVPDYDDDNGVNTTASNDTYVRLGKASPEEIEAGGTWAKDGYLDYTDGDYVSTVKGQSHINREGPVSTITKDTSYEYGISRSLSYSMSNTFKSSIGISGSANTGLAVGTYVGVSVDMKLGASFSYGAGASYSFTEDVSVEVSKDKIFDISERFWAKIDPPEGETGLENVMENWVPKIAAGVALASSAASVAISIAAEKTSDTESKDALNICAETHAATVYAAGATLAGMALAYGLAGTSEADEPAAELDLWKGGIVTKGGTDEPPYAKLQVQDPTKDTHVKLRATTAFNKVDKASYIDLINNAGKATVSINAANTESSSIDLVGGASGDGKVTLTAGTTSITMKDDSIVIKCAGETFTFDEKGLTLKEKDITISKGSLRAKKRVEAKKIKATGSLKSPEGDVGGIKT